ncbi:DNA repair protein RadC [Paenibacillus sp. FSL A5-0031]|uniref:JAB domain-containing protein n=1 Tax=Paenibacillus sp. FSL A5-0031 TaxID=1920420 RepID=UPI00096F936A|nr:JAB domain-containing protein [Paenibacillus sp. FSL A5-0031]OME80086.1 DNA repair protein RadC [Paenibacillus sp. FSL A5-0031]
MQLTEELEKAPKMKRLNIVSLKLVKEATLSYQTNVIRKPQDAFQIAKDFFGSEDREHCILICLDTKNKVNAIQTIGIGSLNAAIVHPREVFKVAILSNSASIIFAHNHPSSDCSPSQQDCEITERIKQAGEIIGIELLDSVIVSEENYFSMKEQGLM